MAYRRDELQADVGVLLVLPVPQIEPEGGGLLVGRATVVPHPHVPLVGQQALVGTLWSANGNRENVTYAW